MVSSWFRRGFVTVASHSFSCIHEPEIDACRFVVRDVLIMNTCEDNDLHFKDIRRRALQFDSTNHAAAKWLHILMILLHIASGSHPSGVLSECFKDHIQ